MAKVILMFEDAEDGIEVSMQADPMFDHEAEDELTDAQKIAMKCQEMLVAFLNEQEEMCVIDETGFDKETLN